MDTVVNNGSDADNGARADKARLRARLLAARRAVPDGVRAADAARLADGVLDALAALGVPATGEPVVCAYVPVGAEPGSLDLLDRLAGAGYRVLLPVVVGAAPLEWSVFTGAAGLAPGRHGLREPAGVRLGAAAVTEARAVLVPALAVDRAGVRLGRGGGHYDRSLALARPASPLVAVVRDDEVVAELPAEPHDVRMTAALTPGRGLVRLLPSAR
ncbi:5-formyltetrahydrofolate cyclo-ligase [Goodfellowiella coeruleoviolacea]|uniref:5-formyltetrahydrofolate cyclo-ligase n=1 Tax=Goodfellowiella coeruleoviolacea TaxID=334858 RepID=A0AAE3GK73_9PSEU|nr:5-formyltetrahydrofolate cyclo-ligase [Goodfellowiella coeruleoviolacea]